MSKNNKNSRKTHKIVFLGDSNVGKTCIIERFTNDVFEQYFNPTIGVDFLSKDVKYKNKTSRLQLWDTAGQQKFKSLVPNYLKDAVACVFVFDVSKPSSLYNLEQWINIFRQNVRQRAITIICGNKNDLQKSFDKEYLQKLIQKYKMPFYTASAKTRNGIQQLFMKIWQMLEKQEQQKIKKLKQAYAEQYQHPAVTTQSLTRSQTNPTLGNDKQPDKIALSQANKQKKKYCC